MTSAVEYVPSLFRSLFMAQQAYGDVQLLSTVRNEGILEKLLTGEEVACDEFTTRRANDEGNIRLATGMRRKQLVTCVVVEVVARSRDQNCPLRVVAAVSTLLSQGIWVADFLAFLERSKKQEHKATTEDLHELPRDAFTHLLLQQNGPELRKVLKDIRSNSAPSNLRVPLVRRQLLSAFGRDEGPDRLSTVVAASHFRQVFATANEKSDNAGRKYEMLDPKDEAYE